MVYAISPAVVAAMSTHHASTGAAAGAGAAMSGFTTGLLIGVPILVATGGMGIAGLCHLVKEKRRYDPRRGTRSQSDHWDRELESMARHNCRKTWYENTHSRFYNYDPDGYAYRDDYDD